MSEFKNIDRYIAEFSRRGAKYDKYRLMQALGSERYSKLVASHGVENAKTVEFYPQLTRTVSGRIQTSSPNISNFPKDARNCILADKPLYSIDVVSEELNIIMSALGKDFGDDVYGSIARHIRPTVRAMVVEDKTDSPYAPLRSDEAFYGKELVSHNPVLFSRLFDASFLALDGCSFDDRGSHESFSVLVGDKKYTLKSMQRIVAGSEKALLDKEGGALMLVADTETGELSLMIRDVVWEKDAQPTRDAATGIETTYYHGEIQWHEDESVVVEDDAFAMIREDIKTTLIAYCYGAHANLAAEKCQVVNHITLLKLYDSLGIREGLKDFVSKHREGNILRIDGRLIRTNYEPGVHYTSYASVLVQNIGVAILDELLGIAYANGIDVVCTEHDEIIVATELPPERLKELFRAVGVEWYKWSVKVKPIA